GLKRVPAVLLVVGLACLLLGAAGWAVGTQLTSLVNDLPRHTAGVREKVGQLQEAGRWGLLARVEEFIEEVEKASSQPPEAAGGAVVRVQPERPSLFARLRAAGGGFLGVCSAALVGLLLVICLLIHRETLRNQLIYLAGSGRLTLTTRALDE